MLAIVAQEEYAEMEAYAPAARFRFLSRLLDGVGKMGKVSVLLAAIL